MSSGRSTEQKQQQRVDFRSDTVTHPTDQMRQAMATAEVGDDVIGDDPTVIQLESLAAKTFGKEAALYVASGTMGNVLAAIVHCEIKGSEMIVGHWSHMHFFEAGATATLGGVHSRVVINQPDGTMDLKEIEAHIRGDDVHFPITRLICLENTHNKCGGRVLTAEYTDKVGALARSRGLKLHIDGARLVNAAQALKVPPARLVAAADSASICLSKGLASPVGSVIVGTKEFIHKCRRLRKALGGGWRQAGVLAACGLISLSPQMMNQLSVDHDNAKWLAREISKFPGFSANAETTETNLVFVNVDTNLIGCTTYDLQTALKPLGVLISPAAPNFVRLCTHYQITADGCRYFMESLAAVLKSKATKSRM